MPLAVALIAVADGSAIVTENVYDGRFRFVDELDRMGADVRTEGRHAVVRGVDRLSGAPVQRLDVRAGAALVLAGLAADGETVVLRLRARRPRLPRPRRAAPRPRRRRRTRPRLALTRRALGRRRAGSRPVRSKGIGRPSAGGRSPRASATRSTPTPAWSRAERRDSLRIFEDWPWAPEDDWCRACEEVVDELG